MINEYCYVDKLAAVSALGCAGEWQACVDYMSTDEGKTIGQVRLHFFLSHRKSLI